MVGGVITPTVEWEWHWQASSAKVRIEMGPEGGRELLSGSGRGWLATCSLCFVSSAGHEFIFYLLPATSRFFYTLFLHSQSALLTVAERVWNITKFIYLSLICQSCDWQETIKHWLLKHVSLLQQNYKWRGCLKYSTSKQLWFSIRFAPLCVSRFV